MQAKFISKTADGEYLLQVDKELLKTLTPTHFDDNLVPKEVRLYSYVKDQDMAQAAEKAAAVYEETTGYARHTDGDPRVKPEHEQLEQEPTVDLILHMEYMRECGSKWAKFVRDHVKTYYCYSAVTKDNENNCIVAKLSKCKPVYPLPRYASCITAGADPQRMALLLSSRYLEELQRKDSEKAARHAPKAQQQVSIRYDGAKTHRTSSRKQGKTLQQEHAARVAHFDFEAERQSKAATTPYFEITYQLKIAVIEACSRLTMLPKRTDDVFYVMCFSIEEYGWAIDRIKDWLVSSQTTHKALCNFPGTAHIETEAARVKVLRK